MGNCPSFVFPTGACSPKQYWEALGLDTHYNPIQGRPQSPHCKMNSYATVYSFAEHGAASGSFSRSMTSVTPRFFARA
jgi:hypothetical protein